MSTVKTSEGAVSSPKRTDFIREIVAEDLRTGKYSSDARYPVPVVTRFPPEPNGFLHIGHAKSICLNFGIARDFGGVCHLRMDDTDPAKENVTYVESIMQDVRWLGFDWADKMFYASDYFPRLYELAVQLIQNGTAYVDSLNEQEIREYRGNLTTLGKESPYRSRSIEENLDLFQRMKAGEFSDGQHVLRAKIDMANPNMKMRDPLLYRIRHAHHYRTGDAWCIYPMYDFAHPISDALEGITYSICTLEFENNRELYDWVLDATGFARPRTQQYEFARLNLNYAVMSKRKLLSLVEQRQVSGWDDPRMPTISGMRRRGVTPEALRKFCEDIGVAKANSTVDMAQLEACIRDDLNLKVPRVLCVLRPLKVTIENWPDDHVEMLDAPYYPHDVPLEGVRTVPMSKTIYIERDDFMENPPKGYYRLSPGAQVRLRHAYVITCIEAIKDKDGNVAELRCTYDPTTRSNAEGSAVEVARAAEAKSNKVKGTIHWVSATQNCPLEVRLYDRLFNVEAPDQDTPVNPNSLQVLNACYGELSLASAEPGSRFQFERQGYFYLDPISTQDAGHPVFNRIITLKDSWARQTTEPVKAVAQSNQAPKPKLPAPAKPSKPEGKPQSVVLTPEQEAKLKQYREQYKLGEDEARLLAADSTLGLFFENAVCVHDNAQSIANWIVNELQRALKERSVDTLPFGPKELAELVMLIDDETISGKIAKDVFAEMITSGGKPLAIVDKHDWKQISDPAVLAPIVDQIVASNPDNVALYKSGRNNLFGFFVGQVLKQTNGKANPTLVNELLQKKLSVV